MDIGHAGRDEVAPNVHMAYMAAGGIRPRNGCLPKLKRCKRRSQKHHNATPTKQRARFASTKEKVSSAGTNFSLSASGVPIGPVEAAG
jgi:hypothetical protein